MEDKAEHAKEDQLGPDKWGQLEEDQGDRDKMGQLRWGREEVVGGPGHQGQGEQFDRGAGQVRPVGGRGAAGQGGQVVPGQVRPHGVSLTRTRGAALTSWASSGRGGGRKESHRRSWTSRAGRIYKYFES